MTSSGAGEDEETRKKQEGPQEKTSNRKKMADRVRWRIRQERDKNEWIIKIRKQSPCLGCVRNP